MLRELLDSVLIDVLVWPGNRSLDLPMEADTFAPTTLAHLRDTSDDAEVLRLVALATTPAWSQVHAAKLYARLREATPDGEALFLDSLSRAAQHRAQESNRRAAVSEANTERGSRKAMLAAYDRLRKSGYSHDDAIRLSSPNRNKRSRLRNQWLPERDAAK